MPGLFRHKGWLAAGVMAATCALAFTGVASATHPANTKPPLKHININLNDTEALRTGAVFFMHTCAACHSLQGLRFQSLASPLHLDDKQVEKLIMVSTRRPLDTIVSPMPETLAKGYFGIEPPDLTDELHLRSADWVYTYLTSFYADPTRPTGANNVVFHNVAMPDVFAHLQGWQSPVMKPGFRFDKPAQIAMGVEPLTKGTMTPEQFDGLAKDLVTFLAYAANPHQQLSQQIGFWVLIGLAIFIVLSYLIYRLYWRDIVMPHGQRWWSYWKKR
ncbi:MAG TPA: cytochrome c1 [Nevskiaceae bacterium]